MSLIRNNIIIFIFLASCSSIAFSNEDDAILSTYNIIKSTGGIKDEHCMTYTPSKIGNSLYFVSVKERHDGIKCHGDQNTAPTLYNVLVDEKYKIYTINKELFKTNSCRMGVQYPKMNNQEAMVITKGQSFLFASPIRECKVDGVFLVKGDIVNLIGEQNGFYKVEYKSKRLGPIQAWIEKHNVGSR